MSTMAKTCLKTMIVHGINGQHSVANMPRSNQRTSDKVHVIVMLFPWKRSLSPLVAMVTNKILGSFRMWAKSIMPKRR